MAGIEGKTLNGMIVRVIEQGIRWRREILESYVRGEIPQDESGESSYVENPFGTLSAPGPGGIVNSDVKRRTPLPIDSQFFIDFCYSL